MKIKILALVFLLATVGRVYGTAAYYTGGQLLSECRSDNVAIQNDCIIYLSDISDATFCAPNGVTQEQLRKIYIKYASENPQTLQSEATSTAIDAFRAAFPCE